MKVVNSGGGDEAVIDSGYKNELGNRTTAELLADILIEERVANYHLKKITELNLTTNEKEALLRDPL